MSSGKMIKPDTIGQSAVMYDNYQYSWLRDKQLMLLLSNAENKIFANILGILTDI